MTITCARCSRLIACKNGSTLNSKQKFQCLSYLKHFVEDPQNKIIPIDTKERIRRFLLERVSLEGICSLLEVIPWQQHSPFGKEARKTS